MSTNISLFAQVIRLLPRPLIKKVTAEFQTDKHCKRFTSCQHLVSMIFSQFAVCVSLREISNGLHSATGNLNHLGLTTAPSKSNLAYPLRHIAVFNQDSGEVVDLLTNINTLAASSIALLYRSRWLIETFFRHLKERMSIKSLSRNDA